MTDKKAQDETPKLPYLAIRNWAKFQSTTDKNGKSLEGRSRPYIRDYCDKETDSQYAALSITARYLFDGCRRLKGKTGRNLPNDHMWILRQLDVDPTERGRATHALEALITRGLLIPTDQQVDTPQPAAPSLSVPVGLENIDKDTGTVESSTDSSTGEQEDQNQNPKLAAFNVSGDWLDDLILGEAGQRKFVCVMRWKETLSDFWKGKDLKSLKAYRTVEGQYDRFYAKAPAGKKPHDLPPAKPKAKAAAAAAANSEDFLSDSAAPDKCVCEDPMPDANGDCPEMYGVSCRRCGKFVKYPEDSTPSKAFEMED